MPSIIITPAQARTIHLRLSEGETSRTMLQASQALTDTVEVEVHADMLPIIKGIAMQMITFSTHSYEQYHMWKDVLYSTRHAMLQHSTDTLP